MTMYVVFLPIQYSSAQFWTYPQSRLFDLECFEDIFNVGLSNIECWTIQVPDGIFGQLFLEKLDRRCNAKEKHKWYPVAPWALSH